MTDCPGCGLELLRRDGPVHPYIGASAACWSLYGEVLAREYGDASYRRTHGLTVDAYAVQHPGVPERRSIRSVAVHLVRLCLVLERELESSRGAHMPPRVLRRLPELRWLEPPRPNGRLTIADVHRAESADEHTAAVEAWARDVWDAWAEHHATVRGWLDGGLG